VTWLIVVSNSVLAIYDDSILNTNYVDCTSPQESEGRISLSGLLGSSERLLDFWDGGEIEGGMPSAAVVYDFNPLSREALRDVELRKIARSTSTD